MSDQPDEIRISSAILVTWDSILQPAQTFSDSFPLCYVTMEHEDLRSDSSQTRSPHVPVT